MHKQRYGEFFWVKNGCNGYWLLILIIAKLGILPHFFIDGEFLVYCFRNWMCYFADLGGYFAKFNSVCSFYANNDWDAIQKMYKVKTYLHALFFAHLVLEKSFKAHWVKDNEGNAPPKIHNLLYLAEKTKLSVSQETIGFEDVKLFVKQIVKYPHLNISSRTCNTKDFSADKDPFVEEILKTGIEIAA